MSCRTQTLAMITSISRLYDLVSAITNSAHNSVLRNLKTIGSNSIRSASSTIVDGSHLIFSVRHLTRVYRL